MNDPAGYRKAVLISTVLLCVAATLAWYVVPSLGGMVWHALGTLEILLTRVHAPVAAHVGRATTPLVGALFLPALIAATALLVSLLACLPFRLAKR